MRQPLSSPVPASVEPPVESPHTAPVPPTVRQALDRYLGVRAQWQPLLAAGTSNALYTSADLEPPLVLRLYGNLRLAFGADRAREARVLERIGVFSWAPDMLHNDWRQGWCLMRRYQPFAADPLCESGREQLLRAVHAWQRITDTACFDYAALRELYRQRLEGAAALDNAAQPLVRRLLSLVFDGLDRLPRVPVCLVHHDLHAGNLCWDADRLIILDWEYAGVGNPWLDAVPLKDLFGASVAQIAALPAFRALPPGDLAVGLEQARRIQSGLELLWYWARGADAARADREHLLAATKNLLEASS